MPRARKDPRTVWRYNGRVVGFVRNGVYYVDRYVARRRVKFSTGCANRAAANAEYERFELNPGAFLSRSGRRVLANLGLRRAAPMRAARLRDAHLGRKYQLSADDYAALLAKQGGRCAVCGALPSSDASGALNVDHDHASGAIRGLLCGACNRGIGQLGDDVARLRRAVEYLERATVQPWDYAPAEPGRSGQHQDGISARNACG